MSKVLKIVDIANSIFTSNMVNKTQKEYGIPLNEIQEGLPDFRTLQIENKLIPGKLYSCKIPVNMLSCDNTYNRGDQISKSKILENLKLSKGFSYSHSGVLVAFLRKDGNLILTQGNHRAIMSYLCFGENAMLPVSLYVHSENEDNYVLKESENFHTDGVRRYNATAGQKFKGGYYSGDKEYVNLYEICKSHNISIANTKVDFDEKCTFESYEYLSRVIKMDNSIQNSLTHECLEVLKNNLKDGDTDIRGYVFLGLFIFRKYFAKPMEDIFKNNPGSSFDNFLKFLLSERTTKQFGTVLTTQKEITKGCGSIKCGYYFASRFVGYFNQYCRAKGLKISNGRDSSRYAAITDSSDVWQELSRHMEIDLRDKAKKSAFDV